MKAQGCRRTAGADRPSCWEVPQRFRTPPLTACGGRPCKPVEPRPFFPFPPRAPRLPFRSRANEAIAAYKSLPRPPRRFRGRSARPSYSLGVPEDTSPPPRRPLSWSEWNKRRRANCSAAPNFALGEEGQRSRAASRRKLPVHVAAGGRDLPGSSQRPSRQCQEAGWSRLVLGLALGPHQQTEAGRGRGSGSRSPWKNIPPEEKSLPRSPSLALSLLRERLHLKPSFGNQPPSRGTLPPSPPPRRGRHSLSHRHLHTVDRASRETGRLAADLPPPPRPCQTQNGNRLPLLLERKRSELRVCLGASTHHSLEGPLKQQFQKSRRLLEQEGRGGGHDCSHFGCIFCLKTKKLSLQSKPRISLL